MERSTSVGFRLGRQSSRADLDQLAESEATGAIFLEFTDGSSEGAVEDEAAVDELPFGVRLMYAAYEGDLDGINDLIDSGADVNFRDIDFRTPLHVAACQGYKEVVELLIDNGAEVEAKDRWGSTPLADAIHYKNHEVIKVLEKHGAVPLMAPMHVKHSRDVPDYEIDPREIDFSNSTDITKGTFRKASWRGIEVAVKQIGDDVFADDDKVRAFRDELALLQRVRHPNVVQFLGAVTQSTPMMIFTEYLPKGDLFAYLKVEGQLKPRKAVRFALDIARGISYLHENKPEPIIHCDLEPANILRDDSGNLKVADFGVSKLLKAAKGVVEDRPLTCHNSSCRYMAPELFRNEGYDTKVDVFSFALILQEEFAEEIIYICKDRILAKFYIDNRDGDHLEGAGGHMIEGCPPFSDKDEFEVPKLYANKQRPPFRASGKLYAHGLKELIEECWNENPEKRPTFRNIILRLDHTYNSIGRKKRWKVAPLRCFQRSYSSMGSVSQSPRSP